MRVYLDIEDRQGELFLVATGPGDLRHESPATWAGDTGTADAPAAPGRRLLVAKGTAGEVPDPAGLAEVVDQGRASADQLKQYGMFLFEAAFGQEFWQQLIQVVRQAQPQQHPFLPKHKGLPYMELAIRGRAVGDQAAMQCLRWEALHDGTRAVAAQGTALASASTGGADGNKSTGGGESADGDVSVGIVRLVPLAGFPDGDVREVPELLIGHEPRVLFAVGSALSDPDVRPGAELMGIMQQLDCDGGSIHPRVLDGATLSGLREALATFEPDVLYLVGHGQRFGDGEVRIQFRPEPGQSTASDEWVAAEQLLDAFGEANHTPKVVIITACQTASTGDQVNAAPFAARLVARGVLVVIAMAGDIADTACRVFTRALVTSLEQGVPLATAVLRGRRSAFYRRPGFWSTDWVLPTVFLAASLPSQLRLVDTQNAAMVREKIHRLQLAQEPVFYGRGKFIDAMDELLDGGKKLNVLLAYTLDQNRSFGSLRLLQHLGARAVRMGVLPILLAPFDQDPPKTRERLAGELRTAIRNVRANLGLLKLTEVTRAVATASDPQAERIDLAEAIREDLDDLVAGLLAKDPGWIRPAGQPQVVLLCHRVNGWVDALDDLLGMLGSLGLKMGDVPVPVVMTGADIDPLKSKRSEWSSEQWFRDELLDRFPNVHDEDLLAYQWWLLNPPKGEPVFTPRRDRDPEGWQPFLRRAMRNFIYNKEELFGWAHDAAYFFTEEMDADLIATFSEAAP